MLKGTMSYVKVTLLLAVMVFLGSSAILGLGTALGWIPNPFADPGYGWILPSFSWMSLAITTIPLAIINMKRRSFVQISIIGFVQGIFTPPMAIIIYSAANIFFGFDKLGYLALIPCVMGAVFAYLLSYVFVDTFGKMRAQLLTR